MIFLTGIFLGTLRCYQAPMLFALFARHLTNHCMEDFYHKKEVFAFKKVILTSNSDLIKMFQNILH